MPSQLEKLEREVRRLRIYTGLLALALAVMVVAAFTRGWRADEVIRARGLVIVDSAGRERILLGAPIPAAPGRVRTDPARVRKEWASRFPDADQYMKYYAGYRNTMNGLLVLDEHGFDRLAIGDGVPDPNIGRRIGGEVGLLINDAAGFERTGYGLLTVQGHDRVVLGLDTNQGSEGIALSVVDGYRTGMTVSHGREQLYIGATDSSFLALRAPFFGAAAFQGQELRRQVNLAQPSPQTP